MKFRKLISALIASAMLISLVSISASAAVVFEYDDGYYIDNVMDVSERTPYIETVVTKLTGDEVAALKNGTSGLNNKQLATTSGKYGDTTAYTVYQIDGTFKDVGALGIGYDRNDDNGAYIKMKVLDATMDFSEIIPLSNWVVTVDSAVGKLENTSWTLQNNGNNRGAALNLASAYPTGNADTEEGELIDVDYSFRMYLVLPAGTPDKTISYASANAGVQYMVANKDEGYDNESVEVKVASRSSSFTVSEGSSEPTDEITEADTGYELESKYVKNTETPLTDLQGHDVTLSKNYGIAKFTENIDTVAKNYFLHVVDDKEESADLPINFAEQGFDFESANVSFFAIVRSATHKVVSMTLKAVAKSE